MFTFVVTTVLLLVATYLISRKFGLWAGLTVAGAHIFANSVDFFVQGNLTEFRQIYLSVWTFFILVAYFKTVGKLGL